PARRGRTARHRGSEVAGGAPAPAPWEEGPGKQRPARRGAGGGGRSVGGRPRRRGQQCLDNQRPSCVGAVWLSMMSRISQRRFTNDASRSISFAGIVAGGTTIWWMI